VQPLHSAARYTVPPAIQCGPLYSAVIQCSPLLRRNREVGCCTRRTVCGADTDTVKTGARGVRTGNRIGDITTANAPEKPRPIKALATETRRITKRTHYGSAWPSWFYFRISRTQAIVSPHRTQRRTVRTYSYYFGKVARRRRLIVLQRKSMRNASAIPRKRGRIPIL
jgi:hypothetical protein